METVIRIKNLHDAAVKNLHRHGKYIAYDKASEKNDKIMHGLFNRLTNGDIDYILYESETNGRRHFKIYHRSPKSKYKGAVQLSYGDYAEENKIIPVGDCQLPDFKEFRREGYASGIYKVGKIA